MNIPVRLPTPEADPVEEVPEWTLTPSPFDWQVMIWGGECPRTGFAQPPLEFQFFGKHYSRRQIMQRAADMAECQFRLFWQVREPTDQRFMRTSLPAFRPSPMLSQGEASNG